MNKIVVWILIRLVESISPGMREGVKGLIVDLRAKAAETKNPIDDIFVGVLAAVLGVD